MRFGTFESGDIELNYAACGSVEHPLIICLHGFPESWYSWRHQMPLLARLGYRVWSPDLRGYGETERPRGVHGIETLGIAKRTPKVLHVAEAEGGIRLTQGEARLVRYGENFSRDSLRPVGITHDVQTLEKLHQCGRVAVHVTRDLGYEATILGLVLTAYGIGTVSGALLTARAVPLAS